MKNDKTTGCKVRGCVYLKKEKKMERNGQFSERKTLNNLEESIGITHKLFQRPNGHKESRIAPRFSSIIIRDSFV